MHGPSRFCELLVFGISPPLALFVVLGDVADTSAVGSPFYMAPEVMEEKGGTTKSDVFSFSIIVWETLCEEEPYKVASGAFRRPALAAEARVDTPCGRARGDVMSDWAHGV